MKGPRLELADVVRQYGSAYLARYGKATFCQQRRVLRDIALCRTAALGGHVWQCDRCGHTEVCHDSCRNPARWRDPNCQAAARAEWMEARAQDLLETVEYYHAVFTLPDELALCRKLLGLAEKPSLSVPETSQDETDGPQDNGSAILCPVCKIGRMVEVETIRRDPAEAVKLLSFLVQDTR
jgi:hypothetical protein